MFAFLSALGLVLGLIVSIGGQNAFLLRQGVRKEHVGIVVLVFAVSDAILQAAGVFGIATLVERLPVLETIARWAGALFLLGYAFFSARRAIRGGGSLEEAPETNAGAPSQAGITLVGTARSTRRRAFLGAVVVTWLNPHALVETTVVIGSVSTQFGPDRLLFLLGGITASTVWFVAFGYGTRLLAPFLRTERAWRVLDGGIAAIMVAIATVLVTG
ncbi:MAG TPA: LysE family transporter [Candidatus Agrococcus pullicola]|uniref:LysE family transporter n=1 Tax=Candidatus Agrococcus pullicola TaxID=2838429 RepID=A0A9D1YVB5_9MICO|nr:LysE family transporter [Candidatus Agrococcus pullicola]